MNILYIVRQPCDYLTDSILIGLRSLYKSKCLDYPKKKIIYGELPALYGAGFTLWTKPIDDISFPTPSDTIVSLKNISITDPTPTSSET